MAEDPEFDLLYGFDPLCGWCFGFIPAMEALAGARPDLRVRLVLGGLVTGERVRPYAEMAGYIANASGRMAGVTGQALQPAFFERILAPDGGVVASSIPPCAAILQVREQAPASAPAFAHAVQRAHFIEGEDLNRPALYPALAARLGLKVEFAIPAPDAPPPALSAEFEAARALGVSSFPTILVRTGQEWEALPSIYDPAKFVAAVEARLPAR